MEFKIRTINKDDITTLQEVAKTTFSETFKDINTPENLAKYLEKKFNKTQLTRELENKNSEFYFVTDNDSVVGYLKINTGTAQTENVLPKGMEVERIYVLKSYHGKKVGQILIEKAIKRAREKGIKEVWLGVWENNIRAIKFYKKYGFENFTTHIFRLGDAEQTDNLMKIELKEENYTS